MFFLLSFVPVLVRMTLVNFNSLGLLSFAEVGSEAMALLSLGIIYLPSGFLGGLYTGYRIDENPKFPLIISGLIGSAVLIILKYFTGYLDVSNLSIFVYEFAFPLLGNVVGTYLGGYTMQWDTGKAETISEGINFEAPSS